MDEMVRAGQEACDNLVIFIITKTYPRQQWNDNRLEFSDEGGKIKYLTMTERSKVSTEKKF